MRNIFKKKFLEEDSQPGRTLLSFSSASVVVPFQLQADNLPIGGFAKSSREDSDPK